MDFKTFKNKETGVVSQYPAHYADHPVYKELLEPVSDKELAELEEDKVNVEDNHELPVDQRAAKLQAEPEKTTTTRKRTTKASDSTDKD